MITMASAKATWASCGVPATTSPTAHTPSALVLMYGSATTNPRSSMVTPASSATRPSVRGSAADRDHHGLDGQLLALAERHDRAPPRRIGGVPLQGHPGLDVDAPLLERPGDRPDHVVIALVEDGRERLEHRHRGPEVGEHRARTRTRWPLRR